MAAVWAGTNERTGKRVALKVILLSLSTTRVAQNLFQREALAASRVNHPNVVNVFDILEHEGMTCIVMELLEGESLASRIAREGVLSVNDAVRLLLPAMRGVAAANAQGVIHRDLKPQNIFICIEPDGRIVTTKVLDFGVSVIMERVIDPSAGSVPALAVGTPAYMSPEHILGAAHIDGRADVYGFGVLLYEALTGQMPFPGEPGPALFDHILNRPALAVTLFRPDLPPGLVRIIETAMAREPDQRFLDLGSMVRALEDELAPDTPAPRLLTPLAGVPSIALRDPASGPHPGPAVQAIAKRRPSGRHQETRILFGSPLRPASRETVVLDRRPSSRKPLLPRARSLFAHRGWGALVAAGFAVVLGFFAVSMVMQGATKLDPGAPARITHALPPASKPVAQPARAAVVSTVAPTAVPVVLADSQSPPAASTLATREQNKPESHRRAVTRPKSFLPRRQAARADLARNETARAPSLAPRAAASAKPAALGAGRLSEADF
jgi:serine/threonine-protein kinase